MSETRDTVCCLDMAMSLSYAQTEIALLQIALSYLHQLRSSDIQ